MKQHATADARHVVCPRSELAELVIQRNGRPACIGCKMALTARNTTAFGDLAGQAQPAPTLDLSL